VTLFVFIYDVAQQRTEQVLFYCDVFVQFTANRVLNLFSTSHNIETHQQLFKYPQQSGKRTGMPSLLEVLKANLQTRV